MKTLLASFALCISLTATGQSTYADDVFEVTKVMVHDIINPPAAARYYAYSNLGALMVFDQDAASSLNGFDYTVPQANADVNLELAARYTLLEIASRLLPSGSQLDDYQEELIPSLKKKLKINGRSIKASLAFANELADIVVDYSRTDGYSKLTSLIGYTPKVGEGFWYPTPPAYIEAVEPHWTTIRPFFLDSSTQFAPSPPVEFDMDKDSPFYKEQLMGVYEAVKNRTKEQEEIAKFWDCNPFEVKVSGHTMIGIKKITPGGHWMGITGIACEKVGLDLAETVRAHALVALTLHDAFVSCWDEKYRSERIRPETVINQHLDRTWRPVLQTPPFPEYTSGHSVASAASSVMLTSLFGDNFSFVDDTEVFFGLPERSFNSFEEAANEAAISRLYGGIHYIDACEIGVEQGRAIGEFIVGKIEE